MAKNLVCNAGDPGSIPVSGRSTDREGDGYPLQYSYLGNPMARRAWRATVHGGHKELDTIKATEHTCSLSYQAEFCFLS